jgi:ABC-type transporter Mla subunit MlaD
MKEPAMWESIKKALSSVKESTGIEIPGMPDDLGAVGESTTTALQGLTESASGAVDGVSAATDTVMSGAEEVADKAANTVDSAGKAGPDLFDELFGSSPLK